MCELFTWTLCGGAYEKVESLNGAREAGMDASARRQKLSVVGMCE
jgi:hypothetical protein